MNFWMVLKSQLFKSFCLIKFYNLFLLYTNLRIIFDFRTYNDPEHYGAHEYLTEDHGTCQHSFLSPDGDAVSVTASVNLIWGCKFMSPSTGIIMNNQMDDFASPNITSAYDVPPAKNNFIAPGMSMDQYKSIYTFSWRISVILFFCNLVTRRI